jgi:hypothetical protein
MPETLEIHRVFLRVPVFDPAKIPSPSALADGSSAPLNAENAECCRDESPCNIPSFRKDGRDASISPFPAFFAK